MGYAVLMNVIARVLVSLVMLVSVLHTAGRAVPRVSAINVVPTVAGACEVGKPQFHLKVEKKTCRRGGMPAAVVHCPDMQGIPAQSADHGRWGRWWLPIDFRPTSLRATIPDRILDPPRPAFAT